MTVEKYALVCDNATAKAGILVGQKALVDTGTTQAVDTSISQPGKAESYGLSYLRTRFEGR